MTAWRGNLCVLALAIALTALATAPVHAAKQGPAKGKPLAPAMHKCTDSKGQVYYSDRPGPECNKGTHEEMTRQGTVIDPESAASAGAERKLETPQQRQDREARERRDQAILATYTSEDQIEAAKNRSLQMPLQAVKLAEKKLDKVRLQLEGLNKQAEKLSAQQKQVPDSLTEDIETKQAEAARLEQDLDRKKARAEQVASRYQADLERYRELTAGKTR